MLNKWKINYWSNLVKCFNKWKIKKWNKEELRILIIIVKWVIPLMKKYTLIIIKDWVLDRIMNRVIRISLYLLLISILHFSRSRRKIKRKESILLILDQKSIRRIISICPHLFPIENRKLKKVASLKTNSKGKMKEMNKINHLKSCLYKLTKIS